MSTFIDESGDTGPIESGGTHCFRLAAVWVPNLGAAEAIRSRIRQLRVDRSLPRNFEFKFSKTHRNLELRNAFLTAVLAEEFRIAFSSIDKRDKDWAFSHRLVQQWACATELAAALRPIYDQAEASITSPLNELIVVDDNADQEFLDTVKQQFRGIKSKRRPGTSMIGRVVFRNSISDEMLQLIDMICGATGSVIDGNDRTTYDLIVERSMNPQ